MVNDHPPFISLESIRQALENLLHAPGSIKESPLHELTLIDELISSPDFPPIQNSRDFALNYILTEIITENFTRQRQIHNLPVPDPNLPYQAEIQHIKQDAMKMATTLIVWGYLYYRYIRVELHLSPELFASHVGLDVRTLRRYLNHGVQALFEVLTELEWQARKRFLTQRLLSQLPINRKLNLIGREELFQRMDRVMQHADHRHFMISGTPGSGKSVFVNEWIRRRISNNPHNDLQRIVWINCPESIEHVLHEIEDQLLNESPNYTLRSYLIQHLTLIVVDGIVALRDIDLDHLLIYLSAAEVILIGDSYIPLKSSISHLVMRDFNQQEIFDYLQTLAPTLPDPEAITVEIAEEVQDKVGGNPLAIKLAADALFSEQPGNALETNMARIYYNSFNSLPLALKRAWMTFTLIPDTGLPEDVIIRIWSNLTSANLHDLLQRYLIERHGDNLTLTASARMFMENEYSLHRDITALIEEQFEYLSQMRQRNPDAYVTACIEHVLFTGLPLLSADLEQDWLYLLLHMPEKRLSYWIRILEQRFHDKRLNYELMAELGRRLRGVQRWDKAQVILELATFEAGKRGDFVAQAQIMLEIAILLRIRGNTDKAQLLLDNIVKVARRFDDSVLFEKACLEEAQLAIERRDADLALRRLQALPESERQLLLKAEACLLNGDIAAGIQCASDALKYHRADRFKLSLTYTLIGRLYNRGRNYRDAHHYLSTAVTMLETLNQPFELARAKMNLATVLIQLKCLPEARQLLRQAEQIQHNLGDTVGLAITRHNLEWLNNHTSR